MHNTGTELTEAEADTHMVLYMPHTDPEHHVLSRTDSSTHGH